MWHYQEFEAIVDGVPRKMYATHGVEKVEPHYRSHNTCVFMFGMIVVLRSGSVGGHTNLRDDVVSGKLTVVNRRQLNNLHLPDDECWNCHCSPHHIRLVLNVARPTDQDTPLCNTCWNNMVTFQKTWRGSSSPAIYGAHCNVRRYCEGSVVAFHLYRDELTGEKCGFHDEAYCNNCIIRGWVNYRICECIEFGYHKFSYRAAHMKWMCERMLLTHLPTDIVPAIIMYVLSGIGNAWNIRR